MNAIVETILLVLSEIAPMVQSSANVAKIIQILIELLPTAVKLAQDLIQPIKNIIAALQTNAATSAEQMQQLQDLDAKVDADFEAAATMAEAEDAAK